MHCVTADLVDQFADRVSACHVQFRSFGGHASFCGAVRTVRTLEDNAHIKSLLSSPGHGSVLVVDGGGSLRTALAGDQIAASAVAHDWAGLVLFGAVRDSVALRALPLGIKALGTVPMKSAKAGTGEIDVPVRFGDMTFEPGAWIYADDDGILVSAQRLLP